MIRGRSLVRLWYPLLFISGSIGIIAVFSGIVPRGGVRYEESFGLGVIGGAAGFAVVFASWIFPRMRRLAAARVKLNRLFRIRPYADIRTTAYEFRQSVLTLFHTSFAVLTGMILTGIFVLSNSFELSSFGHTILGAFSAATIALVPCMTESVLSAGGEPRAVSTALMAATGAGFGWSMAGIAFDFVPECAGLVSGLTALMLAYRLLTRVLASIDRTVLVESAAGQ